MSEVKHTQRADFPQQTSTDSVYTSHHRPKLLFVGALPPPHIGPYLANERLLASDSLRKSFAVCFLDLSDHRDSGNIGRFDLNNARMAICHIARFLRLLVTFCPRVVYLNISQGAWGYMRDLGFLLPSILTGRRIVLHLRGSEFPQFYDRMPWFFRLLTSFVLHKADRMIVLGEGIKQRMTALLPSQKITVIPNGIDFSTYDKTAAELPSQKEPSTKVLFLSSLRKRKGIFEFLYAIPAIRRHHPLATFTVAGAWRSDDERILAESYIEAQGLRSIVHFAGVVTGDDKIRLYLTHDIFVFTPTEPEGLPWVILEAMSARLPVVTSDQGAITEVVRDGITGFVVPSIPEKIAEKVGVLLGHPPAARAMGAAGRATIEAHFGESQYAAQIAQVLRSAAGDHPQISASNTSSPTVGLDH